MSVGALAVLGWLGLPDAEARGGRGGGGFGGGGRGGGRGAGRGRGGGGGRNSGRKSEEVQRQRREERLARVALARIEYAKREREQIWNEESAERLDRSLGRVLGGTAE